MAQSAEHILGKDEVISSNLIISSKKRPWTSLSTVFFRVCFLRYRGWRGGAFRALK